MKNRDENISIVGVEVQNFRRLHFARLELDKTKGLIRVTGKNRQGKTSLLSAILATIGGARAIADAPTVNDDTGPDEESFSKLLLTNGFTITRTYSDKNPKGELAIKGGDGGRYGQAKLDQWLGKLSFDPLAFFQLDEKTRTQTLLSLAKDPDLPIKLSEIRNRRTEAFEARTPEIRAERAAKAIPEPYGDRPELVNVTQEMERLQELRVEQRHREEALRVTDRILSEIVDMDSRIDDLREQIANLERLRDEAAMKLKGGRTALEMLPDRSEAIAAVEAYIKDADRVQEQLRPWLAWDEAQETIADAQAEQARLTDIIEKCDAEITNLIKDSGIPVEGLTFDHEGNPLINGHLFSVASGAEKIDVAVSVAIAANPGFRVCLLDEANDLDLEMLERLDEWAKAQNFQIWAVRIGIEGKGDVHIEDGVATQTLTAEP